MVRFEAWLLKGLLGLMWVLPVWMSSRETLCTSLETLKDQLNSTLRRRFLKHNFPINYTIPVGYEEVFRLSNISRLRNESAEVRSADLQDLWVKITGISIEKILKVLPERHPTRRRYLSNLYSLFRVFLESYEYQDSDQYPESIDDIWKRLEDQNYQEWKSVTPKSLLDNCYRTMHCLFKDCFLRNGSQYDYCSSQHWRKAKGTQ